MKVYLYSNGILDVATQDKNLLSEYIFQNGFPRDELVANEFDQRVEIEEVEQLHELLDTYILLELAYNQEFIEKRGFTIESKSNKQTIYVKDDITLTLKYEYDIMLNVDCDGVMEYWEHRAKMIDCKRLDLFLDLYKTFKEMK